MAISERRIDGRIWWLYDRAKTKREAQRKADNYRYSVRGHRFHARVIHDKNGYCVYVLTSKNYGTRQGESKKIPRGRKSRPKFIYGRRQ